LIFFFLCSWACVFPGLIFREHYFIPVLPAVAICAGLAARGMWRLDSSVWLCDRLRRWWHAAELRSDSDLLSRPVEPIKDVQHPLFPRPAGIAFLVAWLAITIWFQSPYYFSWSPQQACRSIYGLNPFVECPIVARYLEQHTSPDQTIAVLGSEPELFFYAKRRSSTGYIYMYPLMEHQPFARHMQSEMIQEIEQARPEFVIAVNIEVSWLRTEQSEPLVFEWMKRYVLAHYEQVGIVDIVNLQRSEFRWDDDAIGSKPQTPLNLQIFRRKTSGDD
jgi:hypothetical protein